MIVQRESKESSVTYVIRKGSDVVAIDERGVSFKKGKLDVLTIYMEGRSAEEIERLGGAGAMATRISGGGKAGTDPAPLLGEYTGNPSSNQVKDAVVGSIRIKTKSGIVTVPIQEIIKFGETK